MIPDPLEDPDLLEVLVAAEIEELHRCKTCNKVAVEIGPTVNNDSMYYTRCEAGHLSVWERRYDVND